MRENVRNFVTEGIVLKRLNYGETDKLLTVLTKLHGKISVLAKGVRKITSRKAPYLELFSHVRMYVVAGRNFGYVTEVEMLTVFPSLKDKLEKIAWTYKIVEQTDRLCVTGAEFRNIFNLLLSVLREIDVSEISKLKNLVQDYSRKLLWELGYLAREKTINDEILDRYLENVMEKHFKSNSLLTRLH